MIKKFLLGKRGFRSFTFWLTLAGAAGAAVIWAYPLDFCSDCPPWTLTAYFSVFFNPLLMALAFCWNHIPADWVARELFYTGKVMLSLHVLTLYAQGRFLDWLSLKERTKS